MTPVVSDAVDLRKVRRVWVIGFWFKLGWGGNNKKVSSQWIHNLISVQTLISKHESPYQEFPEQKGCRRRTLPGEKDELRWRNQLAKYKE